MKLSLAKRQSLTGWIFLFPAAALIALMSFYPMLQALILSLQKGAGTNFQFAGLFNFQRMLADEVFKTALKNTFLY